MLLPSAYLPTDKPDVILSTALKKNISTRSRSDGLNQQQMLTAQPSCHDQDDDEADELYFISEVLPHLQLQPTSQTETMRVAETTPERNAEEEEHHPEADVTEEDRQPPPQEEVAEARPHRARCAPSPLTYDIPGRPQYQPVHAYNLTAGPYLPYMSLFTVPQPQFLSMMMPS